MHPVGVEKPVGPVPLHHCLAPSTPYPIIAIPNILNRRAVAVARQTPSCAKLTLYSIPKPKHQVKPICTALKDKKNLTRNGHFPEPPYFTTSSTMNGSIPSLTALRPYRLQSPPRALPSKARPCLALHFPPPVHPPHSHSPPPNPPASPQPPS